MVAPTNTITMGPWAVSNQHTTRSFRANSPGTWAAVSGLTENKSPGTYVMRVSVPAHGMWMRW